MQNNMEKNTQRGMVKWAPFKSLEEQEKYGVLAIKIYNENAQRTI